MAERVETIMIAASPGAVWAVLADFGDIGHWAPNVDHSCLTTEDGHGVAAVRRVQVGRNTLLERIVEWEPGERLSYAIDGLPSVVQSAINTWSLDGNGSSTTVTLQTRVDTGPRPPQQMAGRVFSRVMSKASVQLLTGLKAHVEQNEEVPPA